MSLLSRISGIFGAPRNEAAVAATPAVTTVPARGGAIPSPSLGGYSARAPETQLDDFTKKYASAPYHSTRARAGHVYFEPRPFVSKLMIAAVAKRAGELFSAEEVKAVADIASKMQRADQQLQENAFSRVSALVRAAMPDIEVAIREGRQPGNFASFEEKQKQTVVIRRAIHEHKRQLSCEYYRILRPACESFSGAAREITEEMDKAERKDSEQLGQPFEPSPSLKAFSFVAIAAFEPILDFETMGVGFLHPSADAEVIWDMLVSEQTLAAPVKTAKQVYFEEERARILAAERRGEELDKIDKAKRLEEINKFNDAIRTRLAPVDELLPRHVHKPQEEQK